MLKFNFHRFIELHHQHWKFIEPRVQQQPNSCGLYSIANVVELCFKPDCFNTLVTYSTSKMREHLRQCLESGNMTPFPKEAVRRSVKLALILLQQKKKR